MTKPVEMKPINKHMIKAAIDWVLESLCTPHLVVNSTYPSTVVPQQFVKDNQILLNINPSAIQDYNYEDDMISFVARFQGKTENIYIPTGAVLGITAPESGAFLPLPVMQPPEEDPVQAKSDETDDKPNNGGLRLV